MDERLAMIEARRDRRAVRFRRRAGRLVAGAAGVVSAAVLASWGWGPRWLRTAGGEIETHPLTAAGILLAVAAVLLAGKPGRQVRQLTRGLALCAGALGAFTLLEHLTGVDLGIDRVLHQVGVAASEHDGRIGPPASINLLLAGAGLFLITARGRSVRAAARLLAFAAAPLPLLAVVGYAYDATFQAGPRISAIAPPTALALLLLDAGLLLVWSGSGRGAASLSLHGAAGALGRRMLLYAVALPVILGWGALVLSRAGAEASLAVSLVTVAVTLALAILVLRDAAALDRMERAKERASVERERSREELARALRREQEARAQAEAANRARDEFLATLSHELRTPLNAILGWTRLLRDARGEPEKLARGLSVLDRNGRALAQVVSDLLDMSRLARGVIQLEREEVDLARALDAAVEVVRPAAEAKGVALVRTVEEGLPRVVGDPGRLQQVAWNLLSNAVKFTPEGGRVGALLSAEAGEVVLTVEDTGDGIPPEFLPHVFERFRQADGSPTRQHGGLGLGLALTRELTTLHGGRVEVESAGRARGATFRVFLPAVPDQPSAERPAKAARPRLDGARILVVDDEVDSRELLLQLLASWGARPAGASSAREALAVAARERPELLVSDIAMPGEDGFALLQDLRRLERALGHLPVPAIALTAFGRPEDRRRVLAGGFDAHVAKPVEPEDLLATLAALLRREPRGAATPLAPEATVPAAEGTRGGSREALAAG
jgi:signal transduction histidine kinase/ActR/RegA family two-component response regulator